MIYQVIVGNIGTVYSGNTEQTACDIFDEYVKMSQAPYGRASGESVTLMMDGEVALGHTPVLGTEIA